MIAPDDPPIVSVVPSSAEVERIVEEIVEERLREMTESGGPLPGTADGTFEDDPPTTE